MLSTSMLNNYLNWRSRVQHLTKKIEAFDSLLKNSLVLGYLCHKVPLRAHLT